MTKSEMLSLLEKAKAATPTEKWRLGQHSFHDFIAIGIVMIDNLEQKDLFYIAAANPTAIESLIKQHFEAIEVIEFYGGENQYPDPIVNKHFGTIEIDDGSRAREFLRKIGEK